MLYAAKIKKSPEASPVFALDQSREQAQAAGRRGTAVDDAAPPGARRVLLTLILLVYGVLEHGWYITEIAALFLPSGLVAALSDV